MSSFTASGGNNKQILGFGKYEVVRADRRMFAIYQGPGKEEEKKRKLGDASVLVPLLLQC